MRDLDAGDLRGMKKVDIIDAYLALQGKNNRTTASNAGLRSANTRLTQELREARSIWNGWRSKYYALRDAINVESVRLL